MYRSTNRVPYLEEGSIPSELKLLNRLLISCSLSFAFTLMRCVAATDQRVVSHTCVTSTHDIATQEGDARRRSRQPKRFSSTFTMDRYKRILLLLLLRHRSNKRRNRFLMSSWIALEIVMVSFFMLRNIESCCQMKIKFRMSVACIRCLGITLELYLKKQYTNFMNPVEPIEKIGITLREALETHISFFFSIYLSIRIEEHIKVIFFLTIISKVINGSV